MGALEAVVRDLAGSHDSNASPELRHAARAALALGRCEPWQACPFCGVCAPAAVEAMRGQGPPPDSALEGSSTVQERSSGRAAR